MKNENCVIEDQDKVLRVFGHELTEQMKRFAKLNGDETMEDFIINSAFEFSNQFEWKFYIYLNKSNENLEFLSPLGRSNTNPLTESEIEGLAKILEEANKIIKICEYKTEEDFVYDATHAFLDRIDRWFSCDFVKTCKPSKAFYFDSEIEGVIENDSKVRARRKFQIIMHKEFLSYIRNLPW